MKWYTGFTLEVLFVWVSLVLPSSASVLAEAPAATWPDQMQAIHRALLALIPLTTSDRIFTDPARKAEIAEKTQSLRRLAEGLRSLKPPGDDDPSTRILADLFAEHVGRAAHELRYGSRLYARNLLNSTPAFCVACHTRTNAGPDFSKLGVAAPAPLPGLTDIENARILVATRQYGAAMKEYDVILHAIPEEGDRSGEWRSAVQGALALAVRVDEDPEKASAIIAHVLSRGFIPKTLRMDVVRWEKTAEDWKKEPPMRERTADSLLAEMRRLYAQAKELQVAPKDRGADLLFLRISALGHELLSRYSTMPAAAEAMYLLGVSYEVMQQWDFWTFHEVIYERCVRQFPKTEVAGRCLERLKGSISDDYMGSKIPPFLRTRIHELEGLVGSRSSL
jgi:hypothetical protein